MSLALSKNRVRVTKIDIWKTVAYLKKYYVYITLIIYTIYILFQASRELKQDLRSESAFALSESSILNRTSSCENYFHNFAIVLKPRVQFQNREKIEEKLNILNSKDSANG
jgi:hypothetical protein